MNQLLKIPAPRGENELNLCPSKSNDDNNKDVYESIVQNLVEAVVTVEKEEEEGKHEKMERGITNEVQLLQKALEQQPGPYRCGLCNVYLPSPQELATHKAGHNQVRLCAHQIIW